MTAFASAFRAFPSDSMLLYECAANGPVPRMVRGIWTVYPFDVPVFASSRDAQYAYFSAREPDFFGDGSVRARLADRTRLCCWRRLSTAPLILLAGLCLCARSTKRFTVR